MQTELYGKQVETFKMGVSVSTGLTYLQQPGLKQLLTCVWQMPGPLIKTPGPRYLKQSTEQYYTVFLCLILYNAILCFYFSRKTVAIRGLDCIWSHFLWLVQTAAQL